MNRVDYLVEGCFSTAKCAWTYKQFDVDAKIGVENAGNQLFANFSVFHIV